MFVILFVCIFFAFLPQPAYYFPNKIGEWQSVRDTISRAEHTVMGDIDDTLFHQKLRAGQALAHLAEGRYHESAKMFTSISPELTNQFNSVISAEDLAMYGALLGLASFDRNMLHSLVIDGVFKARLEVRYFMKEQILRMDVRVIDSYFFITFSSQIKNSPNVTFRSACTLHA